MLTIESRVTVPDLTGAEVTSFLLDCTDERYRAWWPGVHLQLHPVGPGRADHVGETVLMDEFIGTRRVRMDCVVIEVDPGRKLVWQLKKGIRLPAWLTIRLTDGADGVAIHHAITAGWTGWRRLLDPLFRLYFTPSFAAAMDRHAHTEFARLRDLLHPGVSGGSAS